MKTKTPQKERAAAPTTAQTNKYRDVSYRKAESLSSLKLQLGELLLFGNKQSRELWSLLEILLIKYIEERYLGIDHEHRSTR